MGENTTSLVAGDTHAKTKVGRVWVVETSRGHGFLGDSPTSRQKMQITHIVFLFIYFFELSSFSPCAETSPPHRCFFCVTVSLCFVFFHLSFLRLVALFFFFFFLPFFLAPPSHPRPPDLNPLTLPVSLFFPFSCLFFFLLTRQTTPPPPQFLTICL